MKLFSVKKVRTFFYRSFIYDNKILNIEITRMG